MIAVQQFTTVFQRFGRARTQSRAVQSQLIRRSTAASVTDDERSFRMRVSQADRQVTVLELCGVLNHRSYEAFIAAAADLYQQGCRNLVLDLRKTTRIELSGLFALHSVARLYGGESLLNAEAGWAELRVTADAITPQMSEQFSQRLKLLAPQPVVAASIRNAKFCRFLDSYDDLQAAVAAFPSS